MPELPEWVHPIIGVLSPRLTVHKNAKDDRFYQITLKKQKNALMFAHNTKRKQQQQTNIKQTNRQADKKIIPF